MLIFKVGIEIIKAKGKFSFKWKKNCLFFFFVVVFFKQRENKEKDVCKHNMKVLDINTENWEDTKTNRSSWRCLLRKQLKKGEQKILDLAEERRARRETRALGELPTPSHIYTLYGREYHSRIGLTSHQLVFWIPPGCNINSQQWIVGSLLMRILFI